MKLVKIVPMAAELLERREQLERMCFSRPWSKKMLAEELDNQCAAFLVAVEPETEQPVGYAGLLVVADEGYISNVAVDPAGRRQGVANQLLQVFDSFARGIHLAFLTLEVRPSNAAAIALYEGFGFAEAGRRRNYYDLPKEDAQILTINYTEEAQALLLQALLEAEPDEFLLPFVENYRYIKKPLETLPQPPLLARIQRLGKASEQRQKQLSTHRPASLAALTEREYEIVKLMASRLRNREIAEKLFLSEGSVKQYINQIYSKLQIEGDTHSKRKQLFQLLEEKT